ncbi:Lrp/AsnC family transcriptional regulator [Microbacterium sp. SSW1-49]|uniref:Lrp/AsnC family transcriptional regulator n=1 Tax=Microbacterium croceum TaxID=2851645 RepID=A0ABT0FBT8_9MICO|nr:Lrp/AsnC family transcriptional regulator [Microbacterium croceum]MCK2035527.1 Lrp/AsnC family transcriptional regulator [Microbacterium croceum]
MISIDRLDSEIIGRMTSHARPGIAELAGALGVARNTVQSRLRRLEEAGVLAGLHPIVDLEAVGVAVQAFVALELDQRRLARVVEQLTEIAQVLEINTQAGRDDLLVRVGAVTHRDLQAAVTRMVEIEGVRSTVTTMIVSTPLPLRTQPLLEHLTAESGFGRSTPAPE